MRFSIINEIPGRTRLQLAGPVPESDLDALLKLSGDIDGVHKVRVYGRIGQMALEYDEQCRAGVLDALGALDAQAIADAKTGYVMQLEPRKHKLVMDLATLIGAHYARRWFLPTPLRAIFVVAGYMTFLRAALHELAQPRLTVPVLDASAIGISFVKRDVNTAGQTMFLLNVGEKLEVYTRAMSENELINSLLDVPDKAQKVVGDTEVSVAATELEPGDLVAVRTGMSICIDGVVERGSAMVNQATLTGEPLAVERSAGDDVFAGTVVKTAVSWGACAPTRRRPSCARLFRSCRRPTRSSPRVSRTWRISPTRSFRGTSCSRAWLRSPRVASSRPRRR